MNDAPTPPASTSPPEPASGTEATAPPRRPWSILGRLSKAVREQNWFAVVLEVCIVVLGVVIGFQVNAWGASQADERRGQVYRARLLADLQTDRQNRQILIAYYNAVDASAERAVELLVGRGEDPALVTHSYRATEFNFMLQRRATWNEMLASGNAGLLPDSTLALVGQYYAYDVASTVLEEMRDAPYRLRVRSTIPHTLQRSIRETCSDMNNDVQEVRGFRSDCDLDIDPAIVSTTARALRADPMVLKELRYQFSDIFEAQTSLQGDIVMIDRAIAALEGRDPEEETDPLDTSLPSSGDGS